MPSFLVTANGTFTREGSDELDALFLRLEAQQEPKLLLHFHGGLVNDATARDGAAELEQAGGYGPLKQAGWETTYLIWRTGFFEVIKNNLGQLKGDELFERLVQRLLRWVGERVLEGEGARGVVSDGEIAAQMAVPGEPFSDIAPRSPEEIQAALSERELIAAETDAAPDEEDSLYRMLEEDPALQEIGQRIERERERSLESDRARAADDPAAAKSWNNLDASVRDEAIALSGATEGSRGFGLTLPGVLFRAAKAGYRVVRRFLNDRDHGLYCTIVEELSREIYGDKIGSLVWGLMKEDAVGHFKPAGALTLFLARLGALAEARPDTTIRLLVVGHSAGCIVAAHLVKGAASLPQNVRLDLVFMAPAIRIDDAALTIGVANARIANLRIFTMEDKNEQADDLDHTIAGKVYPRSLLYLISGILERQSEGSAYADAPLLGMQRHLRLVADNRLTDEELSARNTIAAFLNGAQSRIIYSVAAGGLGLSTSAITHGTFDNNDATLASVRHIALHGY